MNKMSCVNSFLKSYMKGSKEYTVGELYKAYHSDPKNLPISNKDFASYMRIQALKPQGLLKHVSYSLYTLRSIHTKGGELRIKMVKAMEFIASNINDEDVMETWLSLGVADGDIRYGDLSVQPSDEAELYPYFEDNDGFARLMDLFLYVMSKARKSGGLYCDHVVSKDFFK